MMKGTLHHKPLSVSIDYIAAAVGKGVPPPIVRPDFALFYHGSFLLNSGCFQFPKKILEKSIQKGRPPQTAPVELDALRHVCSVFAQPHGRMEAVGNLTCAVGAVILPRVRRSAGTGLLPEHGWHPPWESDSRRRPASDLHRRPTA